MEDFWKVRIFLKRVNFNRNYECLKIWGKSGTFLKIVLKFVDIFGAEICQTGFGT